MALFFLGSHGCSYSFLSVLSGNALLQCNAAFSQNFPFRNIIGSHVVSNGTTYVFLSQRFLGAKSPSKITQNYQGRFLAERIFRGFLFLSRRVFVRGSCRRILSPHFCEKIAQKNPPGKFPAKFFQIVYYNKSPTHFCRGARPKIPSGNEFQNNFVSKGTLNISWGSEGVPS